MNPYRRLQERLERGGVVVLDGPMGSELVRRGVRWRGHGMLTDAPAVQALHEEYLAAGADVVRTNTFQLSHRTYRNVFRNLDHMRHIGAPGLEERAPTLQRRAVALARAARDRSGRSEVAIAGVLSPLEHCFRPDLAPGRPSGHPSTATGSLDAARAEHAEVATLLAEAGADLLLLESMNTLAEARVAAEAARATGLPVWASFVLGPEGDLLGRESLAEAAAAVEEAGAEAVLVNCIPPGDVEGPLGRLGGRAGRLRGAFAHVGRFDPPSWKLEFFPQFSQTDDWPAERYAATAAAWIGAGARIVGGCCGTTPEHTRVLAAAAGDRAGAAEGVA